MKHKKLTAILAFLAMLFSFLGWHSVNQAITVAGASIWLMPTIWFSLFFITICLFFVVIEDQILAEFLVIGCYLLSFIFVFDVTRVVAVILAVLLISLGLIRIKKDLDLNIKIDIGKSIYTGKAFIVMSMAIVICSQYYSTIKNLDTQALIPKFNLGTESNSITANILAMTNPQFRSIKDSDLTVDEFILKTQEEQIDKQMSPEYIDSEVDRIIEEQGGANISLSQKAALKADALKEINNSKDKISQASQSLALKEGRAKLAEMTGMEVVGDEKISTIFSEIVNNKIAGYFQPVATDSMTAAFLPLIFTLILFLTVIPLANFLWLFFPLLIGGIFRLLVKFGALKIALVTREVERIE